VTRTLPHRGVPAWRGGAAPLYTPPVLPHYLTGLRAAARGASLRPLAVTFLALLLLSPSLAAFGFDDAAALAVSAVLGTALAAGPVLGLAAGTDFASGDSGGEPLRRPLLGPVSAYRALAALAAGVATPAAAALVVFLLLGGALLARAGQAPAGGQILAVAAPALAGTLAATALGILLAAALPRSLALAAAALAGAAAFVVPAGSPVPSASTVLLARDVAFGSLPAPAAALATLSALLLAAALVAATVSVARLKDLAPVEPG
jgi:hypothetical protein